MTEPDAPIAYVHIEPNWTNHQKGLTKREYFAAMATQGFNANPQLLGASPQERALWAVHHADALIACLNITGGEQ